MSCNPILNLNLVLTQIRKYNSTSPKHKCEITDPELKEFYDKLICYHRTRKGLKVNQRMGYILNQFNPENLCAVDIVTLKTLYENYACSNCQ